MSSDSLTFVIDRDREKVVCILRRQKDGHPSRHGAVLKELLDGMTVTGDMPEHLSADPSVKSARSAGSLAVKLTSHLMERVGDDVELCSTDMHDRNAAYVYILLVKKGKQLRLKVKQDNRIIFAEDPLAKFNPEEYGQAAD